MNAFDSLPARTLVRVARHERPDEAPGIECLVGLFAIGIELQEAVRRRLEALQLNEHRFVALLVLFTFEPVPITAGDLAFHMQFTRGRTSELLDQLAAASWITRLRDPHDRRAVFVRLTRAGLNTAQRALHEVLQLLAQFAAGLEPGDHVAAAHAALALHRRAFALLVPSPLSPPASS